MVSGRKVTSAGKATAASNANAKSQPSTPSHNQDQSKASSSNQKNGSTSKHSSAPSADRSLNMTPKSTTPPKRNKAAKTSSLGKQSESPAPSFSQAQTPPSAQRPPIAKASLFEVNAETKKQKKKAKGKEKGVQNQTIAEKEEDKDGHPLHWTAVVDGQIGNTSPLFTRDSDYYFQATSSTVRVHSRATGRVVSTLSVGSDAHTGPVTGLVFNPSNSLQLVTSSLDGTLKIWDYLEGVLLKSIWVGLPITQIASSPIVKESDPSVFVATRKPQSSSSSSGKAVDPFSHNGKTNSIVYSVSLSTQRGNGGLIKLSSSASNPSVETRRPKTLSRIGKMKETNGLTASADGNWLVAIGNKKIHVVNIKNISSAASPGFTKIAADGSLTTIAFHPHEPVFATGDVSGKIRMWNFLNDEAFFSSLASAETNGGGGEVERQAPSTILHWHSHAVSSLTFSPNGAYMASGGEESVLVLWNLNQHNQKEFVPRMGAPIASISVAGATVKQSDGKHSGEIEYAVALKDGSVAFVGSGNLQISRSFARVKTDASIKPSSQAALASLPLPLAIQPVTGHLVLPSGHPSTIQFFSLSSDSHVQDLEIASSNRISRPDETPIEPTRVEKVVFSSDAKWMATLDSRQAGIGSMDETALKFWRWNANKGKYVLVSRVEKPHSKGRITSMSFSPSIGSSMEDDSPREKDPFFVTTGTDSNTKTWQTSTSTMKGGRIEKYWSARSIFKYKASIPSHAAWSTDSNGSLLAVAHGDVVTLWESSSNNMIQVLSCPEMERVNSVNFVGKGGRFLAILAKEHVVLWDLVMGNLIGSQKLENRVEELVTGDDGTFLLINRLNHKKSRVELFNPDQVFISRVLVASEKYSVPYSLIKVLAFRSFSIPTSSSTASTSRQKLSSMRDAPSLLAATSQRSIVLLGSISSNLTRSSGSISQSLKSVDLTQRSFFDELFGLNESEDTAAMAELETRQKEERENSRSIFISSAGDARLKEVYRLFDSPSHLLPNLNSLSTSLFQSILPPASGSGNRETDLIDVLDEEDESDEDEDKMEVDEESEQTKVPKDQRSDEDIQARIRQIQSQDMSHLTDLFREHLTTATTEEKQTTATPKAKTKPNGISTPASQDTGSAKKKQKSSTAYTTPVRGSGRKSQR